MQESFESPTVASVELLSKTDQRRRSPLLRHAVVTALAAAATLGLPYLASNAQQVTAPTEETAAEATAAEEPAAAPAAAEATAEAAVEEAPASSSGDVTKLSDMAVTEDPLRAMSNEPTATSFGFSKPLLETPRTVSFVSEEQLSLFGVSSVQDLVRVVPGAYTTTRYGLQGGINVRAVTADQYFRGMKRLSLQGHVRTVLSAMDSIEVVKGPPSPLYGMGKIGGYTNLIPKSSRAKTGTYLTEDAGFVQATVGSYDKAEVQFGVGGPFTIGEKQGGYYIFGLMENSNSYVEQVGAKQKFVQATASIENFIGAMRLEVGGQLQNSVTSGAYMNRATQSLIDNGAYVTGSPLANLDLNSDGGVGYLESYTGSPVTGSIGAANQSLSQRATYTLDATGHVIPFAPIAGVPTNLKNYLLQHTEINCQLADQIRTTPVTTNGVPGTSRQLPIGFALDPCTTGVTQVNYRRNGSFEREQNGTQAMIYLDLIYDRDPNFTVKNQMFFDSLDTFKDSNLPYGEKQDIYTFEEKVTATYKINEEHLPEWLSLNTLGSLNWRDTHGSITSSGGDFDYRQDVMREPGDGKLYSNTIFWNQLNDQKYLTGAAITSDRWSRITEMGIGLMFDITMFKGTNVILGGRFDRAEATAQDSQDFNPTVGFSPTTTVYNPPGSLPTAGATLDSQLAAMAVCKGLADTAMNAATAAPDSLFVGSTTPYYVKNTLSLGCPGAYQAPFLKVHNTDEGPSYSISLSQQLPWGLRPYGTYAVESLTLDGSNNIINPTVVVQPEGFIGSADLKELGIKSSYFRGKLQITVAAYEQSRTDVRAPDDPGAGADVSSTVYRGVEGEIKFAPTRELYIALFGLHQKGEYTVDSSFNAEVDGRSLGFQDIVAPDGTIYPAEAFLYGGRFSAVVPASPAYRERTGDPQTQAGINATYRSAKGWGALISSNYFEAVWSDRLKTIRLPSTITVDAGVTWDKDKWHLRLSGYNMLDERYWQARSSDTNPLIVTAKPGRTWEFQIKHDF
jgi:outer membrane receptor protein involved in Fe transport